MRSHQINLKPREKFLAKGIDIPAHVWRERAFSFKPTPFGVQSEKLNDRIIGAETQYNSIESFAANPLAPCVYGVSSAPSDDKAKYFAAFLVQTFVIGVPATHNNIVWHYLYGDLKNPLLTSGSRPNLLVLTGLSPNSSNYKLEKARDLLEHFSDIPRIVVIAGEDPITFFATRLYHKLTHLYYHSASIVKRRIECV